MNNSPEYYNEETVKSIIKVKEECLFLQGGAGSGKTHTLMKTIEEIYDTYPSARVLCISYTNVAVEEIKERLAHTKLKEVYTYHSFLWGFVSQFKENLVILLKEKIGKHNKDTDNQDTDKKNKSNFYIKTEKRKPKDETEKKKIIEIIEGIEEVTYNETNNYNNLPKGRPSHDTVIELIYLLFEKHKGLYSLLDQEYDYILIDEAQDTNSLVLDIFLNTQCNSQVYIFGDKMQEIYGEANFKLEGANRRSCKILQKQDNYRSNNQIVNIINKLRTDNLEQKSKRLEQEIIDPKFFYTKKADISIEDILKKIINKGINTIKYDDIKTKRKNKKILVFAHSKIAKFLGYSELFSNENKINDKKEMSQISQYLLSLEELMSNYINKNHTKVLEYIKTNKFVKQGELLNLNRCLADINQAETIGELVEKSKCLNFNNKVKKPNFLTQKEELTEYDKKENEKFEKIKMINREELKACLKFHQDNTIVGTLHGSKGLEYESVLVIMESAYYAHNPSYLFGSTENNGKTIQNLFYVACSRAKNNLVVYYVHPKQKGGTAKYPVRDFNIILDDAKKIFGQENCINLDI